MTRCYFPVGIPLRFCRLYAHGSHRLPPRSLLIKQSERIKKSKDGRPDGSKLMLSSLKDIVSMFQASSESPEDEEREILDHQNYLRRKIEIGELRQLLLDNFALNEATSLMSTGLLVKRFPKLDAEQYELIQEAFAMDTNKSWNEIPKYMKQLQFYFAFGSCGPRLGLPFNSIEKPIDFTFKIPSPMAQCGTEKIHKLGNSQLTDIRTITDERVNTFKAGKGDLMTQWIIGSAVLISLMAAVREWKVQQDPDSEITVISAGPV